MNTKAILFLCLAVGSEAFVVSPRATAGTTRLCAEVNDSARKASQDKWKKEVEHLQKMEHTIEADPDLDNLVEHKAPVRKEYMEKEAHLHDSPLNEIEHSIDNDPYLKDIAQDVPHASVRKDYIEKEAHVHDSLLDEVEHAINNDPDLSP